MSCLAKGKRESTFITALRSPIGEITSNPKQINLILRNFYKALYSWGEEGDTREKGVAFLSKISLPSISVDQLESLDDVSKLEVEKAIKHLALGKAPKPDGYTGEIYKYLGDLVQSLPGILMTSSLLDTLD